MSTSGNVCLICDAVCTSLRNTYQIFHKEATDRDPEEICLYSLLEEILEREIKEDTVHTKILCKKCYKLIDEYDHNKSRIRDIKNSIFNQYSIHCENRNEIMNHLEIIEGTGKNTSKGGASLKIVQGGNLPKKILDIPSSDEEYAHDRGDVEMSDFQEENESEEPYQSDMVENVSKNVIIKNVQNFPAPTFVSVKSESFSEENTLPQLITIQKATRQNAFSKGGAKLVIQIEKPPPKVKPDDDNKPNILKKKLITTSNGTLIQAVEKKEDAEELNKTTLVFEGPPLVSYLKEENIYTCLLCSGEEGVAGEAKAIIEHIKEVHDARLYICDVCGESFTKRQNMSAHMNDHVATEEGDFQCEVCNRIFSNLRLFRIHRRMHNPQNKSWTCETCGKRYSSRNLLEEHLNIHLGVRPYVCQTCNKDFTSKYALKSHERIHESRERNFECPTCGKTFLSHSNLATHEKTHLPTVKEFNCNFCEKQFSTIHGLEIHSVVHTGYRPYVCGVCGKAFSRKGEIRDHERIHTGERPFQCEFCGATFSQKSNLQSHKKATHYEEKKHSCEECGKSFKRKRLLDYHLKSAHTGERPFKCDVCEATFVYPEHFKKHRRIHTGEKPYVCEVCGKAFNSRDNRNAHRFVHSDKKPYECLVCAAGFMRKPLLYQHMQLHGHINDTIVVNQPSWTAPDGQLITIEELSNDETDVAETKVFEMDENPDNEKQIHIVGAHSEEGEILEEMEQVITHKESHLDEMIGGELIETETQIIDTPDGPIQLVKVITHKESHLDEMIGGELTETETQIIDTPDGPIQLLKVITHKESHLDEMIGGELTETETQIIDTPDGPIQLVKVKIPNENGEEEEAWIKIVPE